MTKKKLELLKDASAHRADEPHVDLQNGGEMRSRVEAFDWLTTPLGGIAEWPQSLKTTVDNMLGSGHAMMLAWGPNRTTLYNDAYAPMMGDWHPIGLGRPLQNAWPDVWEEIAPLVDQVYAGETIRFSNAIDDDPSR